jgi:hypothetical protein
VAIDEPDVLRTGKTGPGASCARLEDWSRTSADSRRLR